MIKTKSKIIFISLPFSERESLEPKQTSSIWGIKRILENPNLDLETQINGEYKSIKADVAKRDKYLLAEKLIDEHKLLHSVTHRDSARLFPYVSIYSHILVFQ